MADIGKYLGIATIRANDGLIVMVKPKVREAEITLYDGDTTTIKVPSNEVGIEHVLHITYYKRDQRAE